MSNHIYTYNQSIVLNGPIIKTYQLLEEINLNVNITPACLDINTYQDEEVSQISVCFQIELSTNEQVILENIIINFVPHPDINIISADEYILTNKLKQISKDIKNGLILNTNVMTPIGSGFTHIIGDMTGFDISTGEYTCPNDGIYFYNLLVSTTSQTTNSHIIMQIKNEVDEIIFGTTETLSTTQQISRTFIGNGGLLFTGNKLKFELMVETANLNINLEFKIFRIMF